MNTADLLCMHFIGELPEQHMNQHTWLWLPWIPGPSFCLLLYHAGETLWIWRWEFSEMSSEILCCSAKPQLRGTAVIQQAEIVLTQTPLANLGWRQQRALADLNQSFKVSTNPPHFCSCKDTRHPSPNYVSYLSSRIFFKTRFFFLFFLSFLSFLLLIIFALNYFLLCLSHVTPSSQHISILSFDLLLFSAHSHPL